MECTHFKKANFLKRLTGIQGYCAYHKTNIKEYRRTNYYPFVCCKGVNGEDFKECNIQLRFIGKQT